ncbi:MAG: DUF3015 domain-containing protein, partial [Nitrospirae bacterium]
LGDPKMLKKGIAITLFLALAATGTMAAAAETGAGCGIGKMLFDGKSGRSNNLVAAILNTILIPNTFFMTTAASMNEEILGCDPTKTVLREELRQRYVAANADNLARDMARGGGPHLEALANLLGIDETERPAFYAMSQQEYAALTPAAAREPAARLRALDAACGERQALASALR